MAKNKVNDVVEEVKNDEKQSLVEIAAKFVSHVQREASGDKKKLDFYSVQMPYKSLTSDGKDISGYKFGVQPMFVSAKADGFDPNKIYSYSMYLANNFTYNLTKRTLKEGVEAKRDENNRLVYLKDGKEIQAKYALEPKEIKVKGSEIAYAIRENAKSYKNWKEEQKHIEKAAKEDDLSDVPFEPER